MKLKRKIESFFEVKKVYLILFAALSIKTIGSISINKLPIIFVVFILYLAIFHKGKKIARKRRERRFQLNGD